MDNASLTNYEQELPKDINELINTCHDIAQNASFVEMLTLSPRYKHTKDITPVFVIPSLKSGHFNKLISRLVYPCFTAKLPYQFTSLEDVAKQLFQSLKRDFPKLDVFTFIGVSWSGALALLLAQLLEAEKKQVTLILIDAAPDPVQNWVKTLIDDLDSNLITKYFTLNQKAHWKISLLEDLEEKMSVATAGLESQMAHKSKIAFIALRNKLKTITELRPFPEDSKIKGIVHLYRTKSSLDTDSCNLLQFCKTSIWIHISEHSKLQDIIDDRNTIININSDCLYSYPDSVNDGQAVNCMKNKDVLNAVKIPFSNIVSHSD